MKSIQETRRARLRQIIQENFHGSTTALTTALKYSSPSFVSRLISEAPKNQKPIGARLARKIERAAGRPPFFMDSPEQVAQNHTLRIGGKEIQLEPVESQLVAYFKDLSPDSQEALLGRAQKLYLAEHPGVSQANPFPAAPEPLAEIASKMRKSLDTGGFRKPKAQASKHRRSKANLTK